MTGRYVQVSFTNGKALRMPIPDRFTDDEVAERYERAMEQAAAANLLGALATPDTCRALVGILRSAFRDLN